jgi:hypothetical protein
MTFPDRPSRSVVDFLPLMIALASITLIIAALNVLPVGGQNRLLVEGGVFETLSVVGYLVCIFLVFVVWSGRTILSRWYIPLIMLLFAMRELDFDKSFFTVGLLKSRQYVGDLVALPERFLSVVILTLILTTIAFLVRNELKPFLAGVVRIEPGKLAALTSGTLVVLVKTLDGLGRKLAEFNVMPAPEVLQFAYVVEEVGEMGIPLLFAAAIMKSQS